MNNYALSKADPVDCSQLASSVLTIRFQNALRLAKGSGQDVKVNHVCPDYVNCVELGANFVVSTDSRYCVGCVHGAVGLYRRNRNSTCRCVL